MRSRTAVAASDRSGLDEQAAGQQRHARCNEQRQDAGARDIREPHRAAR